MAVASCTGGTLIVFLATTALTTIAVSRFPRCAGRRTHRSTPGGRLRSAILRSEPREISMRRTDLQLGLLDNDAGLRSNCSL